MRVTKYLCRGIWYLQWGGRGQRERLSTGIYDKPLAEQLRKRKEQELTLAQSGDLLEAVVRDKVENALRTALPNSTVALSNQPKITAKKSVEEYLVYQNGTKGNCKDHVKNVGRQTNNFIEWANVEMLGDITPQHVSTYLAARAKAGDSPKTRLDKYRILSAWFRWAVEVPEYLRRNPAEKVQVPKPARLDVQVYTAEEVTRTLEFLEGTGNGRLATIFATANYAGLRRGEFKHAKIDLVSRTIRVANTKEKATKTKKSRTVPILDQLLPYLTRLPHHQENPFGIGRDLGHFSSRLRELKNVSFQVARHTFCTHLLLNGVSNFVVAEWAGNSPEVIREHYAGYVLGMDPLDMTFSGLALEPHGLPSQKKVSLKAIDVAKLAN